VNLICFSLLAAAAATVTGDADEVAKKDLQQMQGDWAAVAYTIDGTALPEDDVQSFFRTVKGSEYTVSHYRKVIGKGTIKLDATRSPKAIDAYPASAPAGSKPMLGIYALEGGCLKMCFAAPGKDRPKEFTSGEGSGKVLTQWESEKK
jgi:uncharacterized protein (TIGR03067 family)